MNFTLFAVLGGISFLGGLSTGLCGFGSGILFQMSWALAQPLEGDLAGKRLSTL